MQNEPDHLEPGDMNRLILIIALCLISGLSQATFELEDPAELVKEPIEKKANPLFKNWRGSKEVIVAPGTNLYTPTIENSQCQGWQADDSEPLPNDVTQKQHATATTYVGTLVSKVDCQGDKGSKQFSLVRTNQGRLIWVESDKVLSAD